MITEINTLGSTGFGTATSLTNTNSFPNATTYGYGEIPISAVQPFNRNFCPPNALSAMNMPSLQQLEVKEVGETIEMIYKETLSGDYSHTIYFNSPPEERIFKIVYSCVDGKWNKSERIYGKIVPAREEYYDFDL